MKAAPRIRIEGATLRGEMLLEGRRIRFSAQLDGHRLDAEFDPEDATGQRVDVWTAFRALERWIDDNMRG